MGTISVREMIEAVFTVLAAAVFLHPLHKKEPFLQRSIGAFGFATAAALLLVWILPEGMIWEILQQCCYLAILTGVVFACARLRRSACVYVAVWVLAVSRFVLSLWVGMGGLFPEVFADTAAIFLGLIGLYAIIYLLLLFTAARIMPRGGSYDIGPRQMISALLLLLVIECLSFAIYYGGGRFQMNMYYAAVLLAEFYCLTMLYMQTELFKKSALEKEFLTMNLLWQQQKEQYQLTRENIDLINRKCHDLKHQVQALRMMGNDGTREKYLKELEQSVQIYDAMVKTGNEALDTLLTEKSLFCEANDIKISCVVDGKSLGFLDPVDLYAILGNALDNAVEGVSGFSDKAKRLIDLAVYTRNQFLVITVSNPVKGELQFHGGLPVTTKKDKGYHGFGLRSIRHTVQKYDGYINVSADKGTFLLKMIIPLPKQT